MIFTVDLPMPPSVNAMFVEAQRGARRGRAPSPQYVAWKKAAKPLVEAAWRDQGQPIIGKPFAIHIALNLNHQSDVANREKAITDLIVATIPGFPDDCWANRILIERDRTIEAVSVEIVSMDGARPIGEIVKPIVERIAAQVEE